jgi:hypothetical protein
MTNNQFNKTVANYHNLFDDNTDYSAKRTVASLGNTRTFNDWDTNISVRSDYNRRDYDMFRPSEREARTYREILMQSQLAYKKVGLVRNVIDTMGDFGANGIRLQHSDERVHNFYQSWWTKIGGPERSERFLNHLYRHGTVISLKAYASIPVTIEKKWKKSTSAKNQIKDIKVEKRNIPIRYTFLNPLSIEAVGGESSIFIDKPSLVLKLNTQLTTFIGNLDRTPVGGCGLSKVIEKVPPELQKMVKDGATTIPLDPELTNVYYYKKDDWELWGTPMIDSILDDIIMLLKMKQADVAALDGAISNIRLWILGKIGNDAQTTIMPTRAQINKLRNILSNNVGGGVMDLVWGPDIDFKESSSQIWRWLGSEKYEAVLTAIYEGLGIPPSLRASGSTNTGNYVGLNTMIKRLEYGRDLLTEFWEKELAIVHAAMGFTGPPPEIIFDHMILADEAAEKALLIQLWDRDILPTETIQEIFKRLPGVEQARLKREVAKRGKDMPDKASPYHNPEKAHDYNKALLGGGQVTPSELGIQLQPRKDGEKTGLEMQAKLAKQNKVSQTKKPVKSAGRPKSVTETKKRKAKPTSKPSTKAADLSVLLWANDAQENINKIVNNIAFKALNKSNARQLTNEEADGIEYTKFAILSNIQPYEEINEDTIAAHIIANNPIQPEILAIATEHIDNFTKNHNRPLKTGELRQIYIGAYAIFHNSNDNQETTGV